MTETPAPIVIKKINHPHGHHGGAWKVAFADFAVAMMAFFLLMWLMGSTTQQEKAAISEYFDNPSMSEGISTSPAPNAVDGPGGASTSMIQLGGANDLYKKPPPTQEQIVEKEIEVEKEKQRLDDLMDKIKEAIESSQALQAFKDQLFIDITPEGLRIQIVDKENRPMFASGSSTLKSYSEVLLKELAGFINEVPNKITLSGHTDATPYFRKDYGNWELSADRANAARRALVTAGLNEDKVGRVVGLASSVLFDKENPRNPINRRISIIVMNKATEEAIQREESMQPMSDIPMDEVAPNQMPADEMPLSSQPATPSGKISLSDLI